MLLIVGLVSTAQGTEPAWITPEPVTWVVALETAGGGLPMAEVTREPLARLVEALPAGDRLEILAIHTRSSTVLDRTITDADRATLAADVRQLALPSAQASDLGAGLSQAAILLGAAGEGAQQLLLVGNFCHSPPLGSPWADGGFGCRSIRGFDTLNARIDASNLYDRSEIHLFPVATGLPANPRGIVQATELFAPAYVRTEEAPFAAWVDAVIADLPSVRVRPLARREAEGLAFVARVVEEPTSERPVAVVELKSNLVNLGFVLASLGVEGGHTSVTAAADGRVLQIPVEVKVPPGPFSVLPRTDVVEVPLTFTLTGSLTPADALTAVGIPAYTEGMRITVVARAERAYGLSGGRSLGILASALLLGGAGTLAVRRRLAPIRLVGTFTYRRSGGPRHTLVIGDRAEAAVVILPDGTLGLGRREDSVLVIRIERPFWEPRVSARVSGSGVEINARPAPAGWHKIVPGATSFQFQDYRLSWE